MNSHLDGRHVMFYGSPFQLEQLASSKPGLGAMLRFLLQITSLKQGDVLSLQFRAAKVKFQTLLLTSEIPL